MQHTTGVAVAATQFAGTDRRALSQAWYSALHLAERLPAVRVASCGPTISRDACEGAQHGGRANHDPQGSPTGRARGARDAGARRACRTAEPERRAPQTQLALRIGRRPALRPPRGAPPPFAVHGAGGRVHVIVRSDGGRTRIVAACAPPLRERVERAVAHARFALAGHGVRAEVA